MNGQPATSDRDQDVVLHRRVLVAVAKQLHRGGDEQQSEDQEHEREQRQQRGAKRDEQRTHHERQQDPERQHPLLMLGRDRERAHDDHEHEEVVDREALLDDITGEVLGAETPPGHDAERDAEEHRDRDVEH